MLFKAFAIDRNFRSRRREGDRNYSWTEEIRVVLSFFHFFFHNAECLVASEQTNTYLQHTCPSTTTTTKWASCINVTYLYIAFLLAFIILLQRMPESYRQATMQDP